MAEQQQTLGYSTNLRPLEITQDMTVNAPKQKSSAVAIQQVSNSDVNKWKDIGNTISNSIRLMTNVVTYEKQDQAQKLQRFKEDYATKVTNLRANMVADKAAAIAKGEEFDPTPYNEKLFAVYQGSGGAVGSDGTMGLNKDHDVFKGMWDNTREDAYRFLISNGLDTYEMLAKGSEQFLKKRALLDVQKSTSTLAGSTTFNKLNAKKEVKNLINTKTKEQWAALGYDDNKVVSEFYTHSYKALASVNTIEELKKLRGAYSNEKDPLLLDNPEFLHFLGGIDSKIASLEKANRTNAKANLPNIIKELKARGIPDKVNIATIKYDMEDTRFVPKDLHQALVTMYPGMPHYVEQEEKKWLRQTWATKAKDYLDTTPEYVSYFHKETLPSSIVDEVNTRYKLQLIDAWDKGDMHNIVGVLMDTPEYKKYLEEPIGTEITKVLGANSKEEFESARGTFIEKMETIGDATTRELLGANQRFQLNLIKRYPYEVVLDIVKDANDKDYSKLSMPPLTSDEKKVVNSFLDGFDNPSTREEASNMIKAYSRTFKDLTMSEIVKEVEKGYQVSGKTVTGLEYKADRRITRDFGNERVLNRTLDTFGLYSKNGATLREIDGFIDVRSKEGAPLLHISKQQFAELYKNTETLVRARQATENIEKLQVAEGTGVLNILTAMYHKLNADGAFDNVKKGVFNMYEGDVKKSNAYSRVRYKQWLEAKQIADKIKAEEERAQLLRLKQ